MELQAFSNRLQKNYRHWSKWARRREISCYRIYDRDIPEFPLAIDWYDGQLHLQIFARKGMQPLDQTQQQQIIDTVAETLKMPQSRIAVKTRQRQRGLNQYEKTGARGEPLIVTEDGLRFEVELRRYLDTGLFLDHRNTRKLVREKAAGKRVLNLFAYTGSFSVYAAAGGALATVSVDLSNTYQDWTRKNLTLNGFQGDQHELVREDVFHYLERASRERRLFGLIILDPPSFSNSKRMDETLDIQRDQQRLIEACLELLNPNGQLIFSTNRKGFKLTPELAQREGCREITQQVVPEDFKRRLPYRCWIFPAPSAKSSV
ncbi:MAG: class I SAM-dependent methyltransferase [Candidatus Thiodiazotropha sp. (ex. Lucinisca nassula)]|nr:class I SAM-dependent methyltransferase [Candidatus Thiodiazotropha sp. (ex. Lucinisca nassula)]MBW9262491.1 class I SAM-dependent methyltransferase [Candidatus Thiodiazotropha sp. (ex. Lucinisca nassula)]